MATPAATGIELVTSGMSDTEVPRQATSDPLPLCVTTGMRTPPDLVHDCNEVTTLAQTNRTRASRILLVCYIGFGYSA